MLLKKSGRRGPYLLEIDIEIAVHTEPELETS